MPACHQRIVEDDVATIAERDLPWERLAGRKVAVTGAGGFLGRYLVRTLLSLHRLGKVSRPVHVLGMVRSLERAHRTFDDLSPSTQLELMEWDLSAIAVPDLRGSHFVIHAASQASPRYYGTDPVGTLLPNVVGTAALLNALHHSSDPQGLLFVSSSEVYGAVEGASALRENDYGVVDPASVRACYAEAKRAGEALCVAWHHQHRLPTFLVRPFHTYGPGLAPDDGRVFADFVFNVVRGENIAMKSDGSARRAFCYAADAVAGFFTVLLRGAPAQAYNVANPAGELSVLELAELLVRLAPEKRLVVQRRTDCDATAYLPSAYSRLIPDVSRLHALGWQARVDPAEGFKRMIQACQP